MARKKRIEDEYPQIDLDEVDVEAEQFLSMLNQESKQWGTKIHRFARAVCARKVHVVALENSYKKLEGKYEAMRIEGIKDKTRHAIELENILGRLAIVEQKLDKRAKPVKG